ncbi:MAG: ferrous iron transport protein B, partial [Clostridia bacterium]|nr:ferrous iron transport protein B [Clostridia bacterium]
LFGDGWHLFGIGSAAYTEDAEEFGGAAEVINGYMEYAADNGIDTEEAETALDAEAEEFDAEAARSALDSFAENSRGIDEAVYSVVDEETMADEEVTASYEELLAAIEVYDKFGCIEPDPADYGVWVPGIPVLVENALNAVNCAEWLQGLILDGIVAGVGAVLGFVPQMLVLFLLLAFLEACGYMARIAFVLDRVFRRFGLSGKSFIPMLIGTGCGVPGIMASRTIENERDRKMTIMTTTFIPCGAKIPFIAMIAGAIFGGSAWVAVSAYFVGMAAVIVSGIMLKKTKMFAGDPAPFVMELPSYHMPTVMNVLRSMWERGRSFIKKAGTIILLSTIVVWFTTYFGFVDGHFTMLSDDQIDSSLLAYIGSAIAWIFKPLGWGNWQAAVASVTGLVAKENIVGTMGILYGGDGTVYGNLANTFTQVSGYSFLVFNLLCAPCFAAIGAIKREMNNAKWTWFAIGYQCAFAYAVSLMINQFGALLSGSANVIGLMFAAAVLVFMIYMLFKPYGESNGLAAEANTGI